MHINFKYFIVSIGSIFLALGIGILIGSNIVTNETIQNENVAIIEDIDRQFEEIQKKDDKLMATNKELIKNTNNYKAFIEKNEDVLTGAKLSGMNIGIISFNEKENSEELQSTLKTTGANIAFNIVIKEKLFDKKNLESVNQKLGLTLKDENELMDLVVTSIEDANARGYLSVLSEMGLVDFSGINTTFDSLNDIVVFKNTNTEMKDKVEKMEIPFIEAIRGDKPVVVVSNDNSSIEGMDEINKLKIATINNVNQPLGRISLTLVLSNNEMIGAYGRTSDNMVVIPTVK